MAVGATVVVVGSIGVDLVVYAPKLPVRGETLIGDAFEQFPGAKGANQAVAAALAGARTRMLGAVGADANGEFTRNNLARYGVDIAGVETVAAAPTQVALIMVGAGDNQIVIVPGANLKIDAGRVSQIDFAPGDICLAQGETTIAVVRAAFARAKERGAIAMYNPAPAAREQIALLSLADIILVNETECALFSGLAFEVTKPEESLRVAARALNLRPEQVLVVTLGEHGLAAAKGSAVICLAGHRVAAVDSTGAGDCFVGYFAAALARGDALEPALREANAAAALSVEVKGAMVSFPPRERVAQFLAP